jgi:predicted helicase
MGNIEFMSTLRQALEIIRKQASNTTELGTAFEKLCKVFLENDATQAQQYSQVWHYSDWAKNQEGYGQKDIGIDLVAKLRDEDGYCAIQCKFYQPEHTISKEDLDSFISASATKDFNRLLLLDTSTQSIGPNAQSVFDNLTQDYIRVHLSELEQSRIDWLTYVKEDRIRLHSQKTIRDHQIKALEAVKDGLEEDDRGKIIMACGTGKTYTSLKIAEDLVGTGGRILYMVPSLALMSQTVREWKNDAINDFTAFSACSDIKVGKRSSSDDVIEVSLNDLAFPATTDAGKLSDQVKNANADRMTVVFSTYHSIDVISSAQNDHGLDDFDLIICDEAHRTTGATLVGEDESNFVRIHNNDDVKGKKRLYMTATPRIFGETAKKKAEDGEVALASMDDEDTFGKTLFHRGFGWAVENNLLTDYKVVVLAVDEGLVSERVHRAWTDGSELKLDDATKMIGCYKALAKVGFNDGKNEEEKTKLPPMRQALAFCQNISLSKMFSEEFMTVVNEYIENEEIEDQYKTDLEVELEHVDGTYNAERRNERLNWLKDETENNVCRVLTNARCLSEGVDVPALDAIMFLHPRKSQIDVVQSVGRVMRRAEGKDLGYVILPITVAPGVSPEKALNDNDKYKVVWQILNALRAHDERFDSTINKIGLGEDVSDRLEIIGVGASEELEATTAVVEDVKPKPKSKEEAEEDIIGEGEDDLAEEEVEAEQLAFVLNDLSAAIKAKIVDKCGTRDYWENWASDIAKIAQAHITRISKLVLNEGTSESKAFNGFVDQIRDELNPEISKTDAVEMLAQHLVTKPVFDTLFQGNKFTAENPISKEMETILRQLDKHNIENEAETLEKFYASVRRRAADIMTATGRQALILELYDRFFRNAFPALTQKLGIVYTPVEVVDFIIQSVEDVMQEEFEKSLGSPNVHILDPFTGTGTFITRLMQSDIIKPEQLPEKYKNEIHANEIVLLAYYIAAINIEAVYDEIIKENQYQPFKGIVLTDTFQLFEQERDLVADLLPDNSNRRTLQKNSDIKVIIANPPYSAKQQSANDNLANISYPNLDKGIEVTYAAASSATNKNALYDSYIRAIRWASDRIGDEGVIGFVTNAGWIDGNATDGLRKHLKDEFCKIYVFHLRGDARTSGELRRKEKGNVFGEGSRSSIAITILVKNPHSEKQGMIFFNDIGDYLSREQKLLAIKNFGSIKGIAEENKWKTIEPDEDNDWINQGDKNFGKFISIGNKRGSESKTVFNNYSMGVKTNRDVWCYNFSKIILEQNMKSTIHFYNSEVDRYFSKSDNSKIKVENFISGDSTKISWNRNLRNDLQKNKKHDYSGGQIRTSLYRPYTKQNLYFSRGLNNDIAQIPRIFPKEENKNRVICVTGIGPKNGLSALMTDVIPDLNMLEAGAQCFPLKLYENQNLKEGLFFNQGETDQFTTMDGISDEALQHFQTAYQDPDISKDDLFYYLYGLLHSLDYRNQFQNNLTKELPRIPTVKRIEDFKNISEAGNKLGQMHTDFESMEPYPITIKEGDLRLANITDPNIFYRVEKMKYGAKKPNQDKTTVIYNNNITMQDIPLEAYEYIVNGKSALDWVMDRQIVKTEKASGIVNDANDYANETMNNPAYPLELFQRVITVSLETMKIVRALPKLDID